MMIRRFFSNRPKRQTIGDAAGLWGQRAKEKATGTDWARRLWQSHPITQSHLNRLMTGDATINWLSYVKDHYCNSIKARGVSLGCGDGVAERELVTKQVCCNVTAYDLSPEAIEVARNQAKKIHAETQIEYHVANLETLQLTQNHYDLALVAHAIHHVSNLEHVAVQLHRCLKPDGLLIVNEYVGPSRFQWPDKVNLLMNELLRIIPRAKRMIPGSTLCKEVLIPPTIEEVIAVDPTESIRSEEILPILNQYFETDYIAPFGGTLLQFLLADIIANFDEHNPMDQALINLLVCFEETLIKEQIIQSDFVFVVMRPRTGPSDTLISVN